MKLLCLPDVASAVAEKWWGKGRCENLLQVLYIWKALLKICVCKEEVKGQVWKDGSELCLQLSLFTLLWVWFRQGGIVKLSVTEDVISYTSVHICTPIHILPASYLLPYPSPYMSKLMNERHRSKLFAEMLIPVSVFTKLDIHRLIYISIFLRKVYICHNHFWNGERSWTHFLEVRDTSRKPSRIYHFLITKLISVLFLRKILSEVFQNPTEIKLI